LRVPFFEVGACAEGTARTGYDCAPQRRLIIEPLEDGVKFMVPSAIYAIEGLGAIETDEKDGRGRESYDCMLDFGWWCYE
jgi:hypothetical protein